MSKILLWKDFKNEYRGIWRGKRVDNGEWVEGFYSCATDNFTPKNVHNITTFETLKDGEIIWTGMYAVNPSTLGECIGKRDKYGIVVFEGDIIKCENKYFEIIWDETDCEFCTCTYRCGESYFDDLKIVCKFGEVVSNIHLNPELLKST